MIQDILNQVTEENAAFESGPASEARRLAALERYQIMDTPREVAFDRITGLAARWFEVPMALVSLVDDERQWFKSVRGLEVCQTPREISFCAHALHTAKVLVVPDALRDERFFDNPLVTDSPHIRFYAGAPLETPSGEIVGTLCVLDTQPRQFSVQQQQTLRDLAAMVVDEMELRLAQEQLGSREQAFRALLDNSSDVITVLDAQGMIAYESPSVENVLGYRPAELVGRSGFELVHPDDRQLVKNTFAKAALETGQQEPVEFRFAHRDGSWRVLEAIGQSRLDDPAVRGIVVNSRDITARKRDEAILREQQQQLKMALRAGGMATWEWDARRNRMRWSEEMQTLFGPALANNSSHKAASETSETSFAHDMGIEEFLQIVHPDDCEAMLQTLHSNTAAEPAEETLPALDFRIVWRDGQVRHLASHGLSFRDENDVVERILGVTRDCTQAHQAQEELRQSEERFKNAFEQSDIGMALVAPDGRWLQVNRRLCDFLGYANEELLQLDFQSITYPDDLEKDLALVRQLLDGEINSYQLEKRYVRRDGGTMWGLLNVSLVRDENGEPHNFISQIQDITERRHGEERLRLLESVAVHANDAIVITEAEPIDHPGPRILYVNEAFTRMSGYSREEVIGQTPRILQGAGTSRETCDRIRHALERWKPVVAELMN